MLRCFDTAVILLGSHKLAESTSEVVSIVSPPLLYQNHRRLLCSRPLPSLHAVGERVPTPQWYSCRSEAVPTGDCGETEAPAVAKVCADVAL